MWEVDLSWAYLVENVREDTHRAHAGARVRVGTGKAGVAVGDERGADTLAGAEGRLARDNAASDLVVLGERGLGGREGSGGG